jgi:hypothetical protein
VVEEGVVEAMLNVEQGYMYVKSRLLLHELMMFSDLAIGKWGDRAREIAKSPDTCQVLSVSRVSSVSSVSSVSRVSSVSSVSRV